MCTLNAFTDRSAAPCALVEPCVILNPAATGEPCCHADLPPPLTADSQFFLQVTFSSVAAAFFRVAITSSLILTASSLRRGSRSGIS
ncbi:hypothetical protein I79_016736 [Cricetulus griseus]|uniref:Uncharacterized protein n=1 Tax=Cricetulus griseus TaxID=10029 RepID=G3I060_CRIGR|nr:hypothetical protein I79_016736 [Cricetulus griseus]